jgi:hypothetical protein
MPRVFLTLAIVFLVWAPAAAQVKVTRTPPEVKTHTFQPKKPPAEMPPLSPGEAAVTQSKIACRVKFEIDITQVPGEPPTAKVVGLDATLQLSIAIWLPTRARAKIRAHENGHREISETYYAKAEQAAREIANKFIGRQVELPGVDPAQTTPIIQRLADEFYEEHLRRIEIPLHKVQENYDRLTDHGRDKMSEEEAIKHAMEAVE